MREGPPRQSQVVRPPILRGAQQYARNAESQGSVGSMQSVRLDETQVVMSVHGRSGVSNITTSIVNEDPGVAFEELLDPINLQPAFQPIIDLSTMTTVGVEALARWPHLGVTPDQAFALAARVNRLEELDVACRNAAIDEAMETGLGDGFALFVNLEPSTMTADSAQQLIERTRGDLFLVAEITERSLTARPAQLLRTVQHLRAANCAVALDDVGADPDSLSLLPLIAPSVVKLDISLIRRWPDTRQGAILATVAAYAERTGAVLLAEGVENESDLEQAMALGATLVQGWLFGYPGPLESFPAVQKQLISPRVPFRTPMTPFDAVDVSKIRIAKKGLLLAISHHLENQGLLLETPPIILSAFQNEKRFTPQTIARYNLLAERCSLVAALGEGMIAEPVPGVRGVQLSIEDRLRDEWVVVVVGTHYHGALIAKDLGDDDYLPDLERRFAYVVTHDYETVLSAARSLLERVAPRTQS